MRLEELMDHVVQEPMSGCWLWTGALHSGGYAQARIDGRTQYVHRLVVADQLRVGLQVDHLCRVRACVNPAHLDVVTQVENIRRGISPPADNGRRTTCVRGHSLGSDGDVYVYANGGRQCRPCKRLLERARRRKERA